VNRLPSDEDIAKQLDRLDERVADDLESEVLEFKPWQGPKDSLSVAIEISVCFANARGGVVVFGVKDKTKGRRKAITGCKRYDLDVWRRGIYDSTRANLSVEVHTLDVPEGTLLVVKVPQGPAPPYGTSAGLYKIRIGKNCMPYSPEAFQRRQVSLGAVDWSSYPADSFTEADIDPGEVARVRDFIGAKRPGSHLCKLKDRELLIALGAIMGGRLTRAGMLLFGRADRLARALPNHEVIYLSQMNRCGRGS